MDIDHQAEIQKEVRNFRMHPALLWSVIQSQAGTPEKALLEAIMNAVDAGATACHLVINEAGYEVHDDGRGFQSRVEIEEFFETFGTPHKEGDSTYGKFRMGRGQLFAFSKSTWRSGEFSMFVDIKNNGLHYDLSQNLTSKNGCSIFGEWYQAIDLVETIRIRHDLSKLAQWMSIDVVIDGKTINKSPSNQEWTMETDDAYIQVKSAGGLAVYNLGALVRIYPAHQFGLSGTIVTKTPLKVNFARNDILISECLVWKRIRRCLDKLTGNLIKKKTLHGYERDALVMRLVRCELSIREVQHIGLITDVSGKYRTLRELMKASKICVVPDQKDWTIGERVLNQGLAFVIHPQTLHRFGVDTLKEFQEILKSRANITVEDQRIIEQLKDMKESLKIQETAYWNDPASFSKERNEGDDGEGRQLSKAIDKLQSEISEIQDKYPLHFAFNLLEIVTLSDVSAHITDQYNLLQEDDLAPHQKAMLSALQSVSNTITQNTNIQRYKELAPSDKEIYSDLPYSVRDPFSIPERKMIIGKSDVADAWTDGETFVAVNLDVIIAVLAGKRSVTSLMALIVHEFCHEETDIGGHIHSPEFYEKFHERICSPWESETIRYVLLRGYAKAIAELGKKPNAVLGREIKSDTKLAKELPAATMQ